MNKNRNIGNVSFFFFFKMGEILVVDLLGEELIRERGFK